MDEINSLEMVALLVDNPEHGLRRGDVGTVVEVFEANEHHPHGFIVEFVRDDGQTYAEVDITDPSEIVSLRFAQEAA